MSKLLILLPCIFCVLSVTKADPPSFLTICKSDDSKCARDSAEKVLPIFAAGLPKYGVESLDPAVIKTIDASSSNLKFLLNDVTVTGLKNCEAQKIQRDVAKSKIYLKFLCTAELQGQYELGGQILVIPVEGKGKIHAWLNKAVVNLELDTDEKNGDDGKKRWRIKSWTHSYELKEKSHVTFDKLFEGNEVLGRAARELIANNGNDIIKEIGSPVIKAVVAKVVKNINHFFKAIPAENLSID